MTESFPTLITFIGSLPTVDSLVQNKACTLTESLPTLIALIRLLPCMDSLVQDQACILTEGFTTLLTVVAFYFVVDILVGKKGCGRVCRQKNGPRCRRGLWQGALLKACAATRDAYVQTFLLDQLRWCGCGRHVAAVRALVPVAAEVKSYIAWTASEIDGSAF